MLDIKRKFKAKNIQALYDINNITEQGNIITNTNNISIYKIHPINILNINDDYKNKIYATYMSWIKNIDNVQIIINNTEKTFDEQIKEYENRIKDISSIELKKAINKYIEYLKQENIEKKSFVKEIYIVTCDSNKNDYNSRPDIEMFISGLSSIGVEIEKVIKKEEIIRILKAHILKESHGDE